MPKSKSSSGDVTPPQSTPEVGAGAPDPAKCRAELIAPNLSPTWCLVDSHSNCRFVQTSVIRPLCCHPQRERIVARTLAEKRSGSH